MASVSSRKSSTGSRKSQSVLSPVNVSRILPDQIKSIEKMMDHNVVYPLFGYVDLEELVHKAYLSLKVDDQNNKPAGAMIVDAYPNISALPHWDWKSWLKNHYGLEEVNSRNTLWIHLLLWEPAYYTLFLRPIVHRLFNIRNYMHNLILVLPPGPHRLEFLDNLGTVVLPKGCTSPKNSQILYLMQRQDFVITYKIRRAVEEDNDDLIPLIEKYSVRLQATYGSFYIAELLTRHKDAGRKIIVAEYQGSAVAVLCLNETVNYKLLNEEYELVPFNGLKKPHVDDPDLILEALHASVDQFPLLHRIEEEVTSIIEEKLSVETVTSQDIDQEYLTHVSITSSDDYSLVFTSASLFIFQDDDEGRETISTGSNISRMTGIMEEYYHLDKSKMGDLDAISKCFVDPSQKNTKILPKIPSFMGEPNAFALEIAAAHPDHENGLKLLFESSFESFPDREYCVMSVPTIQSTNNLTNFFVRLVQRSTGTFPYEVYALHRNSVLSRIDVQIATRSHEKQVKFLMSTIPNHYNINQQLENYLTCKDSPFNAFVFLSENQVAGVSIVSEEFDSERLIAHYDLVSIVNPKLHRTGSHGLLETFLLSPIFLAHAKYFLREIHRLSDFSLLYYKHFAADSGVGYKDRPLLNILSYMIPVLPNNQPEYDLDVLRQQECEPSPIISDKPEPFALYLSILPHTSLTRFAINQKILVLGCTSLTLAFLESLLLLSNNPNQMVTFNNVTMVCQTGLSHTKIASKIRDSFLPKKSFLDPKHLELISLRTYVNITQGKLTKIDRRDQYIVLNDNTFLQYDLLFLLFGEQFLKPSLHDTSGMERPDNVFIINHGLDANNAVIKLKHLHSKFKDTNYVILVYGHFLQAYCTLSGLLNFGVPGWHMVFIEPFPYSMTIEKRHRHNVSVFNDPDVDQAILDHIKNQGIKIYSSYYFIDWVYNEDENMITSAKFESRHNMLEIECIAMFCFHEKGIVPRIYKVLNNAGLVFDGRLVIDTNCQTNDPKIYAAGTLTKYSRKYYAAHMTHKYFNRVEIGHKLGFQIRNMLLPPKLRKRSNEKASWNIHLERGDSLVPLYEKPNMRYCRLPGGLYYLSIVKPGRPIPLETAISVEHYGQVLITGSCRDLDTQGFFRLHLNQFKRVETITCLSKVPIDVYNIYCLYGKHEKMLNNLQLRFEMVLITDFFEYFKEPWVYAIYHNRFSVLLDELNILMTSAVGIQGESLITDLIEMYNENKWKRLTDEQEEALEAKFTNLSYGKIIEQKVLEFIQENWEHLPMYAIPMVVKTLLEGFNTSPMFSK